MIVVTHQGPICQGLATLLETPLPGFEYGLDVDTETRDDDFTFECEGVNVVIDPFSAQYLTGLSIGYHSSFQGTGFTFENPNATGSCGCGTSFAV